MFAAQISTGLVEGSSLHMGMRSPELFDVRRVSAVRILVGTGRPIVAIVAIPMLSMDDHTPRGGASTNDLSCERSSVYKSRKPVERGDIGVAIERLSQIITLIS